MRPLTLSAITGVVWTAGLVAMLALVGRHGTGDAVLLAATGIGLTCILGTLAMAWVVERAARRQGKPLPDPEMLAAGFAGLPIAAAILARTGAPLAVTTRWADVAGEFELSALTEPGRHSLGAYNAYVTALSGDVRLVALVRAGAVIPAAALERFAAAMLSGDAHFRFDATAVERVPPLAVFNHILSACSGTAAAFTHSQPALTQSAQSGTDRSELPVRGSEGMQKSVAGEGSEIGLSDREFSRIRARVQAIAGISLSDAKRTLVISRLSKIVRSHGLRSFTAYLDFLEQGGNSADEQAFVNALTTNLTRFFREDHHFEHLRQHVAHLIAQRPRVAPNGRPRLRIWSAGCSTGQEPYTIALSLLEAFPELTRWDFKILATDIDSDVLARAARGLYPASELDGLSPDRARLFERSAEGAVRIPARARELVTFNHLNLMASPWPFRGPFDAIFCRNVAIYFDKPTQGKLFDRLGQVLAPDGFLYIGHSENLSAVSKGFKLVGRTVYQFRDARSQRDAA